LGDYTKRCSISDIAVVWVAGRAVRKNTRRFGLINRLYLHSQRINQAVNQQEAGGKYSMVSWWTYSSTLKMDAIYSSKTSGFFQITRHYNPQDFPLYSKSYRMNCILIHMGLVQFSLYMNLLQEQYFFKKKKGGGGDSLCKMF
jgi:hypothetical protein